MARWFWWFAATLVVTLLFVGGDCLRKPVNENVEGHDTTIQSRGGSRFNMKAEKKIVTTPVPFTTLTRSTRRGTTRREIPRASSDKNHSTTLKNHADHDKNIGSIKIDKLTGTSSRRTESLRKNGQLRRESLVNDLTKAATEDRRYLPEVDDKRPIKFQDETNLETPVELSPNERVNQRGRLTSRGFNSKNIERRSDSVEFKRAENSQSIVPADDLKQRSKFMSRKSSFVESQIPSEAINRATENPRNSKKRFTERGTEKQDSGDLKLESSSKKADFTQKKSAERLRGSLREKISTTLSPRVNRRGSIESKNQLNQSRETRTESRYNNDRKKPEQSTENIQPTRKSETPRKMEKLKKQEITQKSSENNKIKSDVVFVTDELSTVAVERVMTTTEAQIFTTVLPTVRTKTSLKDELPGRNLKLRSRKVAADVHSTTPVAQKAQLTQTRKNYELTMSRRLPSTNSPSRSSTTSSTTINTVTPSTTTEPQSTSSARNIKHSNKTSVTLKTDRELDETENYPPEFKEKLAQLKSSDTKNLSSKTSVQVNEDNNMLMLIRHLRSTENQNSKDDNLSDESLSIKNRTMSFVESNNQDISYGLRQRLLDVSSSSRSQVNLTNARKVIEPQEKREEPAKINLSGATRQTGRSSELAIKALQPKSSEAFGLNEPKTIKGPTRFGTSRPSSTTNRASVTVTFPTIDKKITRPSKIISRKTDRLVEPHKINSMIKYKTENSEIVKTTVPYQPLTPTKETMTRSVQPIEKESSTTTTTTTKRSVSTVRPVRPWNVEYIDRNWQEPTTRSSVPVKKLDFMTTKRPKAWNLRDTTEQSSIKSTTTQSSSTSINKNPRWKASTFNYEQTTVTSPRNLPLHVQRREFRPRTSTYRRHSGLPVVENLIGIKDSSSISITPKIPNYNSSDNTENMTHRSTRQEPAIEVSNSTINNSTSNDTSGISLTSRGSSGNSDSNIFNPSKSTYLISSNASLLEQLRSTVAPLLSALGNRTPIFSGSYSNVHNSNSQSRSTPSGAPPRFSARYRGAELFVRKPNSLDSSGPSSTNPFESTEDTLRSPDIAISSPGEPKVITFYQALESASITNEIDQTTDNVKKFQDIVQVEPIENTVIQSNVTNNANNDTARILEKNLDQVMKMATSLNGVEESQDPVNESTTMPTIDDMPVTQTNVIETPIESTVMPQSVLNREPSTTFVFNPTEDMETTASNAESTTTLASNDVSNGMMNDLLEMIDELPEMIDELPEMIDELPEMMLTTMETLTTTENQASFNLSESLQNSTENTDTASVFTTIIPEILMTESTTISSQSNDEIIKNFSTTAVPSTSTIEITHSELIIPTLKSLAQFTEAPSTTQVIYEAMENITTAPSFSTVTADPDFSTTTIIPEISSTFEYSNSNESLVDSTTDLPGSFDNELLTMINRLMTLLIRDNTTYLQNIQQQSKIELENAGRLLGGFLDNTSRNITLDIDNSKLSDILDSIRNKNTSDMDLSSQSMQSLMTESATMALEMQTMFPSDTLIFETTTPNTNSTINKTSIIDPVLLTTSVPEILKKSSPENEEPSVITIPELTTNPQTMTLNSTTPDTILLTVDLDMLAGLQNSTPVITETTAGIDVQSTTTISPTENTPMLTTTQQMSSTSPQMSSTSPDTPRPEITSENPMNETTVSSVKSSNTSSTTNAPTTQYTGRFGGSRITPAPRFSSSSSTRQPLRDYHVYGIYPNKTIVRKRPKDNLIDARNVDSPYVIFGIYPDGKLVRKYPNGTVIPDPPIVPVEIVFTLSTSTTSTTTNRPLFNQQLINQSNKILNNQNDTLLNNQTAVDVLKNPRGQTDDNPSQLNIGLSSNALRPNGNGPNQTNGPVLLSTADNTSNQSIITKMTEVVSDMEMKSSMLSTTEKMENILTTPGPPTAATPSSVTSQGGRIIQDGERDKASRTKEAGGQRSTVYIGQEKFIDYWTDDPPGNNSRVISVKINSVTKAINGLPPSSNQEIIENIQNTTSSSKPWNDPLDQIFGIPKNSSSNVSDEPVPSRSSITESSINSFSGVLTPMLNDAQLVRDTLITTTTGEPSVSTTDTTTSPTTTTTTTTTTTSTTPPPTTTTTMSPRPTTSTTTTTTTATSFVPSTFSSTMSTTSTTPSTKPSTTTNIPMQTPFGTTFDDLAFLNSLLQPNEYLASASSTSKSLTEVEQLLANKILSLALAKPGPSRSAKAIQPSNSEPNSLDLLSNIDESSQPIIIDLLQTTSRNFPPASTTTSKSVTWKPVATVASTKKITEAALTTRPTMTTTTPKVWTGFPTHPPTTKPTTTSTTTQKVWTGFPTHPPKSASTTTSTTITTTMPTTTKLSSTKKPIIKPVQKPKPTEAPFRFGAGLLKALFGRNIFAPQTTQRPALTRQPIKTTQKPILSTTTTASPEEDAKFLVELLNEADKKGKDGKKSQSPLTSSDESFLRSILNGQAKVKTPSSSSSTSGNAALIAELLKSQGIEPSTPANQLHEQLQSISQTGSTSRPRPIPTKPKQITVKNRIPSSTYPSPLFSNFNFGFNGQRQINSEDNNGGSGGGGGVRNQMLNAALGATRVFSQFLGAAITGAAKQFQSFVKNSTRVVVDGATV